MRNIFKLAEAIEKEIPDDNQYKWLRAALQQVTHNYRYKAPEQWSTWFDEVARLLQSELGNPSTTWKEKIADIFADRIKVEGA